MQQLIEATLIKAAHTNAFDRLVSRRTHLASSILVLLGVRSQLVTAIEPVILAAAIVLKQLDYFPFNER